MKIVLIFVSTLDGKVTKWGDPHVQEWSSQKDHDYFKKTWNDSQIIIMGSNTFNVEPPRLSKNHTLIVMTTLPSKYKNYEVLGQLEFTDEAPKMLISRLKAGGYERVLVVGGPHISTSFLKDQLINELWLTIEPKIFGIGGNFVIQEKLEINLHLDSYEKVNKEGTLILKYSIIK
jgi:dihydrofolate reductase